MPHHLRDMNSIKRILQSEIEQRLKPQKAMLLFGARRVGKTVLLGQIVHDFQGKSLVLNGESLDTQRLMEDRTISNYRQLFAGTDLLAIDEAQHIPDIGMKLKLIVDEIPGIRVIATGSSSFDLNNNIGEPLVGRSTRFMLTPLALEELTEVLAPFELLSNLDNYIVYGNYPELQSLVSDKDKQEYLNDVADSYLLRDILAVDGVKQARKMYDLLRLVAYQTGSEVSLDELGKQLGLSRNTVDRYLDLLQKAFVLFRLGGFARNLRKEVGKASKWYFYDTGIRNAVLRDYKPMSQRNPGEQGALWENFVISERLKRNHNHRLNRNFYFWRTYDQQEIDLIEEDGEALNAIEVKAGRKHPGPPVSFAKAYPEASFNIVNRQNILESVR